MRILITGASGLLGLNLALELCREHTVFGTANQHALHTDAFTILQADLLAPGALENLFEQSRPDWVIHCAALANLEACEADPALASQLNTELPRQLAQLCKENRRDVTRGGARLVHISTDAVFDGSRGNYTETDEPSPLGVYARTKLEAEWAVAEVRPQRHHCPGQPVRLVDERAAQPGRIFLQQPVCRQAGEGLYRRDLLPAVGK